MSTRQKILYLVALIPLCFGAGNTLADSSKDIGEFIVHYNAVPTEVLNPTVARAYGIQRGKNRGLLSIAVLKKVMGTAGTPVPAMVSAYTTNLNRQVTNLDVREIKEQNAIYYVSDFRVSDQETLKFTLSIKPESHTESEEIIFSKQFFVN